MCLYVAETKPTRIEIEINGSANISCQLNLATFGGKKNSTSLYFVEEDTGQAVPSDNIDILNDTTIVFMLRNAIEQDRNYICKSDTMGIGVTHVAVGTSPLDVTDFKCRGYDYTYLVCNFTIPRNVLLTQYNLSYTAQSPVSCIFIKLAANKFMYIYMYVRIAASNVLFILLL
uniref:Uncharacterized protein n=1 Tax=Glossina palpalis gambiensis TaxID=67801 RepID=A0A1B0ALP8_9MUSC